MGYQNAEIYELKNYPEWIDKWVYIDRLRNWLYHMGLYNRTINSVMLALNTPNVVVEWRVFDRKIGGMCCKFDYLSTIYLNSIKSAKLQQFNCAHELIHYWFHPSGVYICSDTKNLHRIYDLQANWGAIELKMPENLFKQKAMEFSFDINALSDFFNVGEIAIKNRINNLSWKDMFPGTINAIDRNNVLYELQGKTKIVWSKELFAQTTGLYSVDARF